MTEHNNRRGFFKLMGAGAATAAALVLVGEETHGETPKRVYKGTSKKGDIHEALQNAIAAAQRSVRHPDAMVEWTLKSVAGKSGGFANFDEVTVTIEAKVA
jgi:hypothetical protein